MSVMLSTICLGCHSLSIDSFLSLFPDSDTVRWSCSSNVIVPP